MSTNEKSGLKEEALSGNHWQSIRGSDLQQTSFRHQTNTTHCSNFPSVHYFNLFFDFQSLYSYLLQSFLAFICILASFSKSCRSNLSNLGSASLSSLPSGRPRICPPSPHAFKKYGGKLRRAAAAMSIAMSAPSVRKKKSFVRSSKPSVRMCIREQRDVITMSSPEMCWPVPMPAIGAQNLLTMPGGVSTSGYLHKKGGSQFSLMKWPLRYIIIHKGCMYYFKSSTSPAPQGAFSLNGYNRVMRAAEETTSSNVFPFKIVHFSKKHRTWLFSAASEDERRKWMRYLRREIDHYNERSEAHIPSDSDSDADSFYGTIEKTMDIKHHVANAADEYGNDDDDDEEDYLEPDSDCSPTSTGRPTGPPPSYPPPPVPVSFHLRQDSSPVFHKAPPPPIPLLHRIPTSPLPKKPPTCFAPPSILKESHKGPPPPLPFAPHLHKSVSPVPPPPPPPNAKRALQCRVTSVGGPGNDKRDWRPLPAVSVQSPANLPICDQLEARMVLNGPAHCSLNAGGSKSVANNHHGPMSNHRSKPSLPPQYNFGGSSLRPVTPDSLSLSKTSCSHPLVPGHPPLSPLLKPGLHNKPVPPKPPPPTVKPPLPAAKSKPPGIPLQRASPDGQSFRSSGDETPVEFRRKRDSNKHSGGEESDDDYENMQLPDSVFIDTTETSFIEKLVRESPIPPQDGLYFIRNSGTKKSRVLVVWDSSIGKARNYRLFEEEDLMFLDSDVTFPTLSAVIEHYYSHPLPHHGSLCLQLPYTKELSF